MKLLLKFLVQLDGLVYNKTDIFTRYASFLKYKAVQ